MEKPAGGGLFGNSTQTNFNNELKKPAGGLIGMKAENMQKDVYPSNGSNSTGFVGQPSTGLFGAAKPASSGGLFDNKKPAENDKSKESGASENKPLFAPTSDNSFGGTKILEGVSAQKLPADALSKPQTKN